MIARPRREPKGPAWPSARMARDGRVPCIPALELWISKNSVVSGRKKLPRWFYRSAKGGSPDGAGVLRGGCAMACGRHRDLADVGASGPKHVPKQQAVLQQLVRRLHGGTGLRFRGCEQVRPGRASGDWGQGAISERVASAWVRRAISATLTRLQIRSCGGREMWRAFNGNRTIKGRVECKIEAVRNFNTWPTRGPLSSALPRPHLRVVLARYNVQAPSRDARFSRPSQQTTVRHCMWKWSEPARKTMPGHKRSAAPMHSRAAVQVAQETSTRDACR